MKPLLAAHKKHRGLWEDFLYAYAVVSRRSGGVSIGVNLNPDKACNFDCVYCEVDRKKKPRAKKVDLKILADELQQMLNLWKSGEIFTREPFKDIPKEWRRLNDIAFSGDGEPTTCPVFAEAVQTAFDLREKLALSETKLVLITNSTCLARPNVKKGLQIMQNGAHEVWAKLDAGTEEYYRQVDRSSVSFKRILKNITETSRWLPLKIQSLFLRMHGQPPPDEEIEAYCHRVQEILDAGGQILGLQLYTIARPTPEKWAAALSKEELDRIAQIIRSRLNLPQQLAYG